MDVDVSTSKAQTGAFWLTQITSMREMRSHGLITQAHAWELLQAVCGERLPRSRFALDRRPRSTPNTL